MPINDYVCYECGKIDLDRINFVPKCCGKPMNKMVSGQAKTPSRWK